MTSIPEEAKRLINTYFGWMPQASKASVSVVANRRSPDGGSRRTEDHHRGPSRFAACLSAAGMRLRREVPSLGKRWFCSAMCSAKAKASRLHRRLVVDLKLAQSVEVEVDPAAAWFGSGTDGDSTARRDGRATVASGVRKSWLRLSALRRAATKSCARSQRPTCRAGSAAETPLGQSLWLQQQPAHGWAIKCADADRPERSSLRRQTSCKSGRKIWALRMSIGDWKSRLCLGGTSDGSAQGDRCQRKDAAKSLSPKPMAKSASGRSDARAAVRSAKSTEAAAAEVTHATAERTLSGPRCRCDAGAANGNAALIETAVAIPVGEADAVPAKSGGRGRGDAQ